MPKLFFFHCLCCHQVPPKIYKFAYVFNVFPLDQDVIYRRCENFSYPISCRLVVNHKLLPMVSQNVMLLAYLILREKSSSSMSKCFDWLLISLITNSKKMSKGVGERRYPCLTPTNTLNHSVSLPSIVTTHLEFLQNFSTILVIDSFTYFDS